MTRKSPERVVVEELLEHNEHVNVVDVCDKLFGYDRIKISKLVYEVKNRVQYKSIYN